MQRYDMQSLTSQNFSKCLKMRLSLHRKVPTAHASYYSLADLACFRVSVLAIVSQGQNRSAFPKALRFTAAEIPVHLHLLHWQVIWRRAKWRFQLERYEILTPPEGNQEESTFCIILGMLMNVNHSAFAPA